MRSWPLSLDAPELTVRVDYTFENDEKKEVQNTFVLHISRDPEERKAAEKAAESGEDVALVPRSDVVDLMEAVNAIVLR